MPLPTLRRTVACLTAPLAALSCDGTGPQGAGPPAVETLSGDLQQHTVAQQLPAPLVVRVTDARGRRVPNQRVDWIVTAGSGSVAAGTSATDAEGEAHQRWTLGTTAADTQRVEARAIDQRTGRTLAVGGFRAVGLADAPSTGERVAGDGQAGPSYGSLPDSLAVRLRDRFGNPTPNVTATWAVVPSYLAHVTPSPTTSDASGLVKGRWKLAQPLGEQTATLKANGTALVSFTATSQPAWTVLLVSGDGQVARAGTTLPQPIVVRLVGHDGTPLVGEAISQNFPTSYSNRMTDANGRAEVPWTLGPWQGEQSLKLFKYSAGLPSLQAAGVPLQVTATATAP